MFSFSRMWYRFYQDGGGTGGEERIETALERAGIPRTYRDSPVSSSPGVVLFRDASGELLHFVREVSHAGRSRVLAVSLSPERLAAGFCWQLLAGGAADVIEWHAQPDPAASVASRLARWTEIEEVLESPLVAGNLVGRSTAFTALLRQVIEAASYSTGPVLLLGDSGTGKELLARLIHTLDRRPGKRELVVLDCTTIVPELSGSEFFGHERGAFTGAVSARDGAFSLAHGGTLFLDEIGDLAAPLQAQLLRVIQEGQYKRVGGNTWYRTDFRLVCATNRDLPRDVKEGRFRADLYYRLAGAVFRVPSLDQRREDAIPLAEFFLSATETEATGFDDAVKEYLLARDYPGNVRDLKQLVSRMSLRHAGLGSITVGDVPEDDRPLQANAGEALDGSLDMAIRRALLSGAGLREIGKLTSDIAIRVALEEAGGNLQNAARKLQVTDRALQMRRAAGRQENGARGSFKSA